MNDISLDVKIRVLDELLKKDRETGYCHESIYNTALRQMGAIEDSAMDSYSFWLDWYVETLQKMFDYDLEAAKEKSQKLFSEDKYYENLRKYMHKVIDKVEKHIPLFEEDVDEDHEIIDVEYIELKCSEVLSEYPILYCYLFGPYAKGEETETSEIDLLISSDVKGLGYFGIVDKIQNAVHKRVHIVFPEQLKENLELTNEIFCDGIRIY